MGRQFVSLQPGQFVFGRRKAAIELDMPESSVRDYMKLLESMGNITIRSTNKYSVVTVCQWDIYQSQDGNSDSKLPTDQPTDGQHLDTIKKDKKGKEKIFSPQAYDLLSYWNEQNIVVHQETDNTLRQIEKGLRKFSIDEIKTAIDRYVTIYRDPNYYYKHKWTLPKFLTQKNGVPDFLDEGIRWLNYPDKGTKPETHSATNQNSASMRGPRIVLDPREVMDYELD